MNNEISGFPLAKLLTLQPGAIAGAIATVPMTLFMMGAHRLLPQWQKSALPPEQITQETAERAGIGEHMDKPRLLQATLAAHLGYGASMGAAYATVTRKLPGPPLIKGALFGILVWAGSYLGWLPLGRFEEAAPNETKQRNSMMIAAHIIWGAVTGLITSMLEEKKS
jgi:putative membrane protein